MKSEKEIRARIAKLDKLGGRIWKDSVKELIGTYLNLGERYGLWWVLGEVKKHQGKAMKETKKR